MLYKIYQPSKRAKALQRLQHNCSARLGAKRDFEVWTYDSDNSTQIQWWRQFYLCWVQLVWFNFAKCNDRVLQRWFCSVRSPCSTEAITEVILRIKPVTVKFWSQYLQYLERYLEIFVRHLASAVPLLETDNILPICRYIIEILPVWMACIRKNRDLLAAFWDKISMFHLGQTEHGSARGDGPLCAPHRALISFIWCRAT